ncbi:MAG: hypothetical protein AAGI44_03050 [Pseudomonadota bacterium]
MNWELIDTICQIWISMTGITAMTLAASQQAKRRMYAGIFGLLGEPAWITTSVIAQQWGVMVLALVYAFSWFCVFLSNYREVKRHAV